MIETIETPEAAPAPLPSWSERNFWLVLVVVVLAALAWRIGYVTQLATNNPHLGDGFYYHTQANLLADGHGFSNPWVWWFGKFRTYQPSAVHPPLYSLVLAIPSVFGGTTYLWHKLISCLVGAGAVLVLGLVGRRIGGARAGICAAVLAAVYPNLWVIDGLVLSEGLFALLIGLTILAAYRFRSRPTWTTAALLGAVIGLATLCRGEAIFLSVLLVAPLVLLTKQLDFRSQVRLLAVAAVAVVAVLSPWVIRNLTTFEEPFFLSSNSDAVLLVSNCQYTYHGELTGSFSFSCPGGGVPGLKLEESLDAKQDRRRAMAFIRGHEREIPHVVAARVGRVWEVYRPFQNARLSTVDGRPLRVARFGLFAFWLIVPLAAIGGVLAFRRRLTLIPLLSQVVLVTFVSATAYGAVRFRVPAEVALIALAALALDAGLAGSGRRGRRWRPRGSAAAPVADDRMSQVTHP